MENVMETRSQPKLGKMSRAPKANDLDNVDFALKEPRGRGGFAIQKAFPESMEKFLKEHVTPEEVVNGFGTLLAEPADTLQPLRSVA